MAGGGRAAVDGGLNRMDWHWQQRCSLGMQRVGAGWRLAADRREAGEARLGRTRAKAFGGGSFCRATRRGAGSTWAGLLGWRDGMGEQREKRTRRKKRRHEREEEKQAAAAVVVVVEHDWEGRRGQALRRFRDRTTGPSTEGADSDSDSDWDGAWDGGRGRGWRGVRGVVNGSPPVSRLSRPPSLGSAKRFAARRLRATALA